MAGDRGAGSRALWDPPVEVDLAVIATPRIVLMLVGD
jgi:hypothetical protein